MYIESGKGGYLRGCALVGVFDLDTASIQKDTRTFLTAAQRKGCVRDCEGELPKSFLVTEREVILSQLATPILRRRIARNKK